MVNRWFGTRWFGFRKDPLMKGIVTYKGIPGIPNHQNHPFTTN